MIRPGMLLQLALAVAVVSLGASLAMANPVSDLPGRWSGWGAVKLSNGNSEQVKCVATYFLQNGGDAVQQNLRCASTNYKIDVTAYYILKGAAVSGSWEEKTWAATGEVSGKMNGNGFDLAIKGQNFSAAMAMTTSNCKQSISIAPRGFDISQISIGLGKC